MRLPRFPKFVRDFLGVGDDGRPIVPGTLDRTHIFCWQCGSSDVDTARAMFHCRQCGRAWAAHTHVETPRRAPTETR